MISLVESHFDGAVLVFKPERFHDKRGWFQETFREEELRNYGITESFVQDNHSRSVRNVVRGMHLQIYPPMGKLLRCARGSILLIEVDARTTSKTFGQHVRIEVSDENGYIVWIAPGIANGFKVLSDEADVVYKCTAQWNPKTELSINPTSSILAINWGDDLIISDRDLASPEIVNVY